MGFLHCYHFHNKTECRIIALFANYSDISLGFSTYSYFTLQVIELLSNIYSTTVISLSFSHIFKSKIFHNNFISILLCFYGHYYLFTFTRIVHSIFQNGLITLGDSSSYSHTMLMVFSILRFYELFFGVYCSIALTIERVCATLLISDYEVNPRRYISVILIIFAIFMGHLLAYFTTHGIVNNLITSCFIMIGFTIVTVSLFTMISLLIQRRNSNYEKKLEKSNDFYALSLKFQLRENFRAFRLLRRVSLISGIAAICMCIDTYFIIVYEYDKNVSSLLGTLFDTMQACGFSVFVSCGVFLQKSWRTSFAMKIGLGQVHCTTSKEVKVHPTNYALMSDTYFNELGDSWERKLKERENTKK